MFVSFKGSNYCLLICIIFEIYKRILTPSCGTCVKCLSNLALTFVYQSSFSSWV